MTKDGKVFFINDFDEIIIKTDADIKIDEGEYISVDNKGGKLSNPSEIEALKQRRSVDEMKNEMLGHYNPKTGRYEISDNLKEELRNVLKRTDSVLSGAHFTSSVSSFGGLGKLFFIVKTTVSSNTATSTLYVCEPVSKAAGTVENTEVHKVCEFSKTDRRFNNQHKLTWENYNKDMHEEFCILYHEKTSDMPSQKNFFKGLILRQKLLGKNLNKSAAAMVEKLESTLYLARLEILAKLGEYGYSILKDYENLKLNAKKFLKTEQLSSQDQNELLEEAISLNKDKHDPKLQEEFYNKQLPVVKTYLDEVNSFKEVNTAPILENIDKRMPAIIEEVKRYDENLKRELTLKAEAVLSKKVLEETTLPQALKAQVSNQQKPAVVPEFDSKKLEEMSKAAVKPANKPLIDPENIITEEKPQEQQAEKPVILPESTTAQKPQTTAKPGEDDKTAPVVQSELKQFATKKITTIEELELAKQKELEIKLLAEKALLEKQAALKKQTPQQKAEAQKRLQEIQKRFESLLSKQPILKKQEEAPAKTPVVQAKKVIPVQEKLIAKTAPQVVMKASQITTLKSPAIEKFKEEKKGGGSAKKANNEALDYKESIENLRDMVDIRKDDILAAQAAAHAAHAAATREIPMQSFYSAPPVSAASQTDFVRQINREVTEEKLKNLNINLNLGTPISNPLSKIDPKTNPKTK